MEIAKGNENHIAACLSIAKELPQYFTEEGINTMNKDLRTHQLYTAIDSEEVVGFITVEQRSHEVSEISWMAVKPNCQRQGIGSALIDYITTDLLSQGVKLLEAKTLSEDIEYSPYENTRRFYGKMGFMHLETIDPYPGWEAGSPCAIYIKIL